LLNMTVDMLSMDPQKTLKSFKNQSGSKIDVIPVRWHKKKDGQALPVEITYGNFIFHGKETSIAILRDISESIKQIRKQKVIMNKMRLLFEDVQEFSELLEKGDVELTPRKSLSQYKITFQEEKIFYYLISGMRNKEIGLTLSIQESTVKKHITSILRKLNVQSRVELVRFIHDNNIVFSYNPD